MQIYYQTRHDLDFPLESFLILDFLLGNLFDGATNFRTFLLGFENLTICSRTKDLKEKVDKYKNCERKNEIVVLF